MIKFLKIGALLLFFSSAASAQEKIEKYCEVKCNGRNVSVSVGKVGSLFSFKDKTILIKLNKVKDFKNHTDVLNYLTLINWKLVFTTQDLDFYTFIFKRDFDKSELTAP